ncbi:MAG: pyruvate kinase, partial [Nitrospirae bacterium]
AKDRADLEAGLEAGVDLVALSFVRHERDLEPVRERLRGVEPRPLLVAKIEKPEAVERLEAILGCVDGVMVARGDLGVEMRLEEVPLVQKRIIHAARCAGKPVITATQMLRSMVESPRPTRAEASDVANAILDGTDAVMLSEETAVGAHPVEAVRVLDRIARAVEPHLPWRRYLEEVPEMGERPVTAAVSRAACGLARDVGAAAIVASTTSGATARAVARFRPPVPVVALTPSEAVARQLAVSWGVEAAVVEGLRSAEEMFAAAERHLLRQGVEKGQRAVVTAGLPPGVPGGTNLVHVLEL